MILVLHLLMMIVVVVIDRKKNSNTNSNNNNDTETVKVTVQLQDFFFFFFFTILNLAVQQTVSNTYGPWLWAQGTIVCNSCAAYGCLSHVYARSHVPPGTKGLLSC